MRAAIILSVVVHIIVVVGMAARAVLPPIVPFPVPVSTPGVAPPVTESPPIEIEWLGVIEVDDRVATSSRHTAKRIASHPAAPQIDRGPSEPSPTPSEPSGLLTMRRRNPDPRPSAPPTIPPLPSDFVDDFLGRSKPPEPVPDLPGARIDADIAAVQQRMRDAPDDADLSGERQALVALREERAAVELKLQKDGTYEADKTTFVATVDRDGKLHLHDKANLQREGLGARFDVTDGLMRWQKIDPYASEKLRLLDRTRDQRVAIGREYRREQLSRSAEFMQQNIDRMWTTTPDLRARKRGLFELWDECAETGNDELVAGGAAARKLLVGFIQLKLRGAEAYSAEELVQLNRRRRSKAMFVPYG